MSIKTRGKDGQHDRFEFFEGGKHTHEWYDSKTGIMGGHGENASKEDNKWAGQRAHETFKSIFQNSNKNK